MTDSLPLHEIIASDQYWLTPNISLHDEPRHIEGLSADLNPRAGKETITEIAELVLDMSGGVRTQPVEYGHDLPVPSRDSKQVLKVVHDTRTIHWGVKRPRAWKLK